MWKGEQESSLVNVAEDLSAAPDLDAELFHCTVDWTSLEPLATSEARRAAKIRALTVIHSSSLVSPRGAQRFINLLRLNLSSNEISSLDGLEGLQNLEELDLSTNNLNSLLSGTGVLSRNLPNLRELDLSHNQLQSLDGLQLFDNCFHLSFLKLSDNLLSDLQELALLAPFKNLRRLNFKSGQQGTNPFCSQAAYLSEVRRYAPALTSLDDRPLQPVPSRFKDTATSAQREREVTPPVLRDAATSQSLGGRLLTEPFRLSRPKKQPSRSPVRVSGWRGRSGRSSSPENVVPNNRRKSGGARRAEERQLIEQHEFMSERLREYAEQLEERLGVAESERTEWANKWKRGDRAWREKERELEEKAGEIRRRFHCVAEDNRKLTVELEARNKTVARLEKEREAGRAAEEKKEERTSEMAKQMTYMMKNHEETAQRLTERERQLVETKMREQGLGDELTEAQRRVRVLEKEVGKLHDAKVASESRAIERLEAMQRKHEEVLSKMVEQGATIEQLNAKIMELSEVNKQMDYSFQERAKQLLGEKERLLQSEAARYEDTLRQQQQEHERAVANMQADFAQDVQQMHSETQRAWDREREKLRALESQARQEKHKKEELLEDLKRLEHKEARSQAVVKQLQQAVLAEEAKWATELNHHQKALQTMGGQLAEVKEELGGMKAETERTRETAREREERAKAAEARTEELRAALKQAKEEIAKLQAELKRCGADMARKERELVEKASEWERRAIGAEKGAESLRATVDTKNKMLEDKNTLIAEQKEELAEAREEAEMLRANKNNYQEQQDQELLRVVEENELLKHEKAELQTNMKQLEEFTEEEAEKHLKEEEELQRALAEARGQVEAKEQVMETVQREVAALGEVLQNNMKELEREKAVGLELRALMGEREREWKECERGLRGEVMARREACAQAEKALRATEDELRVFVEERARQKERMAQGLRELLGAR